MVRVFSQKLSSTIVDNVGIYNVGTYSVGIESEYQIVQTGRTEYFVGVSQEGLTREILAKHSCLHLS